MATPPWLYACLLATLAVAGAMPASAEEAAEGPACAKSEDDSGLGGSHVTCTYTCGQGAVLGIGVMASDKDAATYGDTSCGGASAGCAMPKTACAGLSGSATTHAEEGAPCHGHSDEFMDSPVTVVCFATAGDVRGLLCDYEPRLCRHSSASARASCLANPQEWVPELLASADAVAGGAASFVVMRIHGGVVWALSYAEGVCSAGVL